MSGNDWEKSQAERKQENFFSDREKSGKKKKITDKPFLVEFRYTKVSNSLLNILTEWHGRRKFETLEAAEVYTKKLGRENIMSRREVRIIDLREGTEQ